MTPADSPGEPSSTSTTPPQSPRATLPRAPFVLLGLMTAATLVGPLVMIPILAGGNRASGLPDRPVEWVALIGITALVLALMVGCVLVSVRARQRELARQEARP